MDFAGIKAITIPEGNVTQIAVGNTVLWQSSPLPSAYQQVEWVKAENTVQAYIDLGICYDSKATIYITQYLSASSATAYAFGAAENSGKVRCMLTTNRGAVGKSVTYCHRTGNTYAEGILNNNVSGKNEFVLHFEEGSFYTENKTTGETTKKLNVITDYTMTSNLYLFGQNYNGSPRFGNIRQFGGFQYYDKNNTLICDLIPCYRKSDGVIGMYDIVRKIFLTNAGTGSFTKGADV